ncbi:hypothetical protein LCGC14_0262480 [marine sediment metagenome]|uniref:Uncharacterized protein n=1 Tax=marine sediment metagenome TaxID=412755 RepID=A0A0F9U5U7_9ZZZZ
MSRRDRRISYIGNKIGNIAIDNANIKEGG